MKKILAIFSILSLVCGSSSFARIGVVASTSDLKSIAEYIGGEYVSVKAIVSGKSNFHFVEVLPSYMVLVSRADLYLTVGLDLDYWAKYIIDGSRNGRLQIVDCSQEIEVLEKPASRVDASMGDIHPGGNPHYWLDPANGIIVARNIERALADADPAHAGDYEAALLRFDDDLNSRLSIWREDAASLKDLEIVAYHNSWPYFAGAFGIEVKGFVEPRPGIEPTPSQTAELIDLVKSRNIKLIIKEPYYSDRTPAVIARATGARVVDLPLSVGGAPEAGDYFSLFDTILARLRQSLEYSR